MDIFSQMLTFDEVAEMGRISAASRAGGKLLRPSVSRLTAGTRCIAPRYPALG